MPEVRVCVCLRLHRYAPLSGQLVVEGVKLGHYVHLAGALAGASFVWCILTALAMYKVRRSRRAGRGRSGPRG